jgi:hypothetical protein
VHYPLLFNKKITIQEEQHMAKAAIVKKYALSANGILDVTDNGVGLENAETGEYITLQELLSDFADRSVKLSVTYDEEYGVEAE